MSDLSLHIDPALLAEFIDESSDMLASTDALFIELESNPDSIDIVQAIFRPVHSIKGNSAFFGFGKVKVLAHEAETLLDKIRKRTLAVTPRLISVLLKATDELKAMLERARSGGPEITDEQGFNALVAEVRDAASTEHPSDTVVLGEALSRLGRVRKDLRKEAPGLIGDLDEVVRLIEQVAPAASTAEVLAQAASAGEPPAVNTLKSLLNPTPEGKPSEQAIHAVKEALTQLDEAVITDDARAVVAEMIDTFTTFMASVGFDPLLRELLLDKLGVLLTMRAWAPPPLPTVTPSSPPAQDAISEPKTHLDQTKTMRVSESHIDTFLSYVGELLVVGDMFNHLQSRLAAEKTGHQMVTHFRRINETFAALSQDLQRSIMSIRKVPMGALLKRAPRLVRDVAAKSGKDIVVVIEGEEVEADKSLIDLLDAPLTHMARNAADHGIEPPDVREAVGKPRQGTVWLSATETDTSIVLTVRDDGKGIDRDALKKKAISMGLIQPDQPLTEDEIIHLLFSSGVSTAQTITDVSGRGVGMDVVRRKVEDANGQIHVSSQMGQGSTFSVQLPKSVTTQIMDGFLVESGGHCYVLPMECIRETLQVNRSEIKTITGQGKCIQHHDQIKTVIDLHEALTLEPYTGNGETALMVTVESRKSEFALLIDGVRGVQQVVFRTMEGLEQSHPVLVGGALLGDGSVAIILNVDALSE